MKQKMPTNNGGYTAVGYGKTHDKVYSELTSDHPIDLTRYQVMNSFMGRAGLINSGGDSAESDLEDAVKAAVINKCRWHGTDYGTQSVAASDEGRYR